MNDWDVFQIFIHGLKAMLQAGALAPRKHMTFHGLKAMLQDGWFSPAKDIQHPMA
ncbi:hypothetical protein AB6T38_09605 [Aliiglaciecola sp. SL4]|uniref:hypothetical protein n=1 Tax=Aliiglaciecola sp. SL4 TaxID=3239806 RepID=UPI00355AF2D6